MQLESPPMLEVLFLESPWALMVVLGVAAVILLSAGQNRRNKALLIAAGAAVLAAAGVWGLARSVTTDREQLMQDTRDLVAATAPLDLARLNQLIHPAAVVTGPHGSVWLEAGQVLPRLQRAVDRITINGQDIRTLQAVAHDNVWGESAVTVRTNADGTGTGPINTGWRLQWQKDEGPDGGWRVVDIRWMRFNGVETPQAVMP